MTVSLSRSAAHCDAQQSRPNLWTRLGMMLAVRRQRKALKDLDAHRLADIGITDRDAYIEAEKPVWDVPRHWSQ